MIFLAVMGGLALLVYGDSSTKKGAVWPLSCIVVGVALLVYAQVL